MTDNLRASGAARSHGDEHGKLSYVPYMSPEVEAAIIAAGVGILTLIGAVYGTRKTSQDTKEALNKQITEQSKQLDKTLAEQREQLNKTLKAQSDQLDRTLAEQRTRTLNERFATAADRLGNDKPPAVRLAAVYAMAGLADDWEENRQTCVDVLCGYLRMPYEPDPGAEAPPKKRLAFEANREVRHTVIRVITAHLKDGADPSWQGLNLDFTGVVFDGGSFNGAKFSGGTVVFTHAVFSGGTVDFGSAEFSGGTVTFTHAVFSGGTVTFFRAEFSGGTVDFSNAKFSTDRVSFVLAQFSGAQVGFGFAEFLGGAVRFTMAGFSGGTVHFVGATFSGGEVSFADAKFSAGTVDFSGAKFSGAEVDFSDPDDWSFPPARWIDTPPPSVKLP